VKSISGVDVQKSTQKTETDNKSAKDQVVEDNESKLILQCTKKCRTYSMNTGVTGIYIIYFFGYTGVIVLNIYIYV
jgi:hypothetical protein